MDPAPAVGDFTAPTDVDAFVAAVLAGYATLGPLEMTIQRDLGRSRQDAVSYDETGRMRLDWFFESSPAADCLHRDPGAFVRVIRHNDEGRPVWQDHGVEAQQGVYDLGLTQRCVGSWRHLGFDVVNDRPTHHVACDDREYWIDREWGLVVRTQYKPESAPGRRRR